MFISMAENSIKDNMEERVGAMKGENAMGCILVDCKNWNHPNKKSQHNLITSLYNSNKEDYVWKLQISCVS